MQFLVLRSAHFNRPVAGAIFAPVTFAGVETFARTAAVADKNVRLLFLIPRMNGHDPLIRNFRP